MRKVLKWIAGSSVILGIALGKLVGTSNIPGIYQSLIGLVALIIVIISIYNRKDDMNEKRYKSLMIFFSVLILLVISITCFFMFGNKAIQYRRVINISFSIIVAILIVILILAAIVASRNKGNYDYFKRWNDK